MQEIKSGSRFFWVIWAVASIFICCIGVPGISTVLADQEHANEVVAKTIKFENPNLSVFLMCPLIVT